MAERSPKSKCTSLVFFSVDIRKLLEILRLLFLCTSAHAHFVHISKCFYLFKHLQTVLLCCTLQQCMPPYLYFYSLITTCYSGFCNDFHNVHIFLDSFFVPVLLPVRLNKVLFCSFLIKNMWQANQKIIIFEQALFLI